MKNIYLTTDTHFGHELMKTPEIGRPNDFEEKIFKGFQSLRDNDVLIHLGDVCMGSDAMNHEKYIKTFKFKKILVRGNHDHKSNNWYLDHGWDFVCESFVWKFEKKLILFTHEPRVMFDEDLNIHGHLHNLEHRPCDHTEFNKLLSLEIHGYKPISLSHFMATEKVLRQV